MKLIRLHLQGFKSFKDKTTIEFDKGITGIVGPNGCGKSNIVDALFWVMGEQSAKHLRGSKMKDLIFAGSSKYTPGGFAQVTLVLENDTGKHVTIGNQVSRPSEIALTRKLYRNGETEYRINNQPARLKDIHEVFMDTGAGAKSYSIIAQGEINKLVQAKPEERRTMIEEVAGITKFKLRKKESLKKIEHTQSNLNRLSDLQAEIYKNLKSLERQAEKAEKARRLKDRIKHHELIVESHKEYDYLSEFVGANEKLITNNELLENSALRKNEIELALEDERIQKVDLVEKIDEMQADYNEMAKDLAMKEERLKNLKSSGDEKENQIQRITDENQDLQNDILARTEKMEEVKEKLQEIKDANYEDMDFSDLEEKVSMLKEDLIDNEQKLQDLTAEFDITKKEFTEIDQVVFRNNSKVEEYSNQLEDIIAEIEEIETTSANFSEELVNQREELAAVKTQYEEKEEEHLKLKEQLSHNEKTYKELDGQIRELSKEVIKIDSRRQSLIEVNKSGEGVKVGALSFIESAGAGKFEVLGNLIESDEKYAHSLEVFFEKNFDSLISFSDSNDEILGWNKENIDKSFDLTIPMENSDACSSETAQRLEIKGLGEVVAINDIVTIKNQDYAQKIKTLFNGFYISSNLDTDICLKLASGVHFKGIISQDGNTFVQKNMNDVSISYRSEESTSMGVIQRNNLIATLTAEFEEKNTTLDNLQTEFSEIAQLIEEQKPKFEELSKEYSELHTQFVSIKSSLESKEKSYGTTSSRLEILNKRKGEISAAKLDILEAEEDTLSSKDRLSEKLENFNFELEEVKSRIADIKSEYETERSNLLELQANAKTFESQLESYSFQVRDMEEQIEKYAQKQESNRELLEKYQEEIEAAGEEIINLAGANSEQAEQMSDKDDVLNIVKDELTQLLSGMQSRENEVKELTATINKVEKSNVELELKVEQIIVSEELLVKNIFDKYKINLRSTLKTFLEITEEKLEALGNLDEMFIMEGEDGPVTLEEVTYNFEKRFPAQLRESKDKFKRYNTDYNRLGEINWQAIEDYERQKLRYDFLKTQEEQLKKSLVDLETAIAHIDEKSQTRFKEAYNEVNERFEKVFPIIFGGGEARLEIVGDISSNECGIDIIAKPPGKKMQSINLMSGGEKAMTAVSLIFSIFLVKPSPFCLLDEVDAPLDDANVGRFNELLREMSSESQFILITHNKKTMELNDTLYGVTMQEPGVSKAVSVQLH